MDLSDVDVVIVARNDGPLLWRSVAAALRSRGVTPWVTIVDHQAEPAITPDPVIGGADGRVRVVRPDGHVSHAHARNLGVSTGHAPWVLIVDPEVHVNSSTVCRLLEQLDVEVAAAAPTFAGFEPEDSAGRAWTLAGALGRHRGTSRPRPLAAPRERVWEIDYAAGACLLFERAAWESVGGFDETFSEGVDDVDFCLRLRASGRHLVQVRDAVAAFAAEPRSSSIVAPAGMRQRLDGFRTLRRHRRTVA